MKVFMTGATGFVGKNVLDALVKKGHSVGCLTRKGSEDKYSGKVRGKISIIEGDAACSEGLAEAMKGYEAVINLIGIIREFHAKEITFEKLNVETTKNLVDAAKTNGILRFVQMSALGARRDARSQYHRTKFEAETYLENQDMEYTVFRPTVIFGPGDSFVTALKGLVKSLPLVPVIGTGEYQMQPVYIDVIAKAFAECLTLKKTIGKTYEVGGPHKIQYKQILNILGKVLGKKVLTVNQPTFVINFMAKLFEDFSFFPISQDQVIMIQEDCVCKEGENNFNEDFKITQIGFQEGLEKFLKQDGK